MRKWSLVKLLMPLGNVTRSRRRLGLKKKKVDIFIPVITSSALEQNLS